MKVITRHITSKGQVTIPQGLRRALGLSQGDRVDFVRDESGHVFLRKSVRQDQLFGLLDKYPGKNSVSLEEIDQVVEEVAQDGF